MSERSQKDLKEIPSEIGLDSLAKCPDALPLSDELWLAIPIEARAVIYVVLNQMMSRIKQLEERVQELEARLAKNSSNSSKPPSSDSPKDVKERPKAEPSARKQGGQEGHPGHYRPLVAAENVSLGLDYFPERCKYCGCVLQADEGNTDYERHQVQEIPLIPATTTEHRLHRLRCPRCGKTSRAPLPDGVPRGSFSPNLQARVALLTGRYRLSKREASDFLRDVLGAGVSVGSVISLEGATSEALAPKVKEVTEAVKEAVVVNVDETGWRINNGIAWLWTVVTQSATIFAVREHRNQKTLEEILGPAFRGFVGSDRYGVYNLYSPEQRALCHAHLKRDFTALVERGGEAEKIGSWALREHEKLFRLWDDFQEGRLSRSQFQDRMSPVIARMGKLLKWGCGSSEKKAARFCRRLLKLWPALWTFVRREGVEPTNNAAERALRPSVLARKGSFGNQSDKGCRFTERIYTTVATCKKQGRNILRFLEDTCEASLNGKPGPSLLPDTS